MHWLLFVLFALILWHLQDFFPPETSRDSLSARGLLPILTQRGKGRLGERILLSVRGNEDGQWSHCGIPFDLRGEQPFIPYYRYAVRPPPSKNI